MISLEIHGLEGSKNLDKVRSIFYKVVKNIHKEDVLTLAKKNTIVFLGDKITSFCFPLFFYQGSSKRSDPIAVSFVSLSSSVTDSPSSEATYTIAHELAHAYLGHLQLSANLSDAQNNEMEADRQVIKWGFEKELRACPDNYLFGAGIRNIF